MSRLHKGTFGPRMTPIDWDVMRSSPQYQALYMGFTVGPSIGGTIVDNYLSGYGWGTSKAAYDSPGAMFYAWNCGDVMGKTVVVVLITYLLDGVDKVICNTYGVWGGDLYINFAWNYRPTYIQPVFIFDQGPPYYSYIRDPAVWLHLDEYRFHYVDWANVPP